MIAPRIPHNEEDRLRELMMFNILDTLPEKIYDDVNFLASQICDTPIALINIIDQDRQWTKSSFGYPIKDTPREIAFCSHTINEADILLEVEDTMKDDRFHDNPLATSGPLIRFYAGAALVSKNGFALGAICVIDRKPRKLTEAQRNGLRALSRQVMSLLELQRKNEQLEVLKRELEVASTAREDFFSSMSHEIRTPLNSIIGIANILQQGNLREDQAELIDLLKSSGDSLFFLVNDVLDIAKINAGKLIVESQDFNLKATIETIVSAFKLRAKQQGLQLRFEYDEELPEVLIGDANRMAQIFNNLLSNAFKFTKEGEVAVVIRHTGYHNEKVGIYFEVSDTGIGIKADHHELIFEKFAQATEDITKQFGGSGLGLTITKNLVHALGGELKVKSALGTGSLFYFELKMTLGNPLKFESSHAVPAKNFLDLSSYMIRVLVVEDNAANQMIAGKFLKKWGIDYDFADNGEIAVEMVKSQSFDLVLMDLHMPVMNGYDAVKVIRSLEGSYFSEVPIIALTASALMDVKGKILDIGIDDYVTKPFRPDELYERITRHTIPKEALETVNEISADRFRPILEELTEGDQDFMYELAGLYIQNYQELMEMIPDLISNKQIEEFRDSAHKIKTSNKTLGLVNFEYHLTRIKNRLINYGPEKSTESISLIQSICEAIIVELSKVREPKIGTNP